MSGKLIGYARVSTDEQGTDSQVQELREFGCNEIHEEHGSGADRGRPVLARVLRGMSAGDTLVVVRLDRLARSLAHLLAVIEGLEAKGAHFRSLRDPVDTGTPQGMFSLQVMGAVAQLERALIAERTRSGLRVARAEGRVGGNPGLRRGDLDAIKKIQESRSATIMAGLMSGRDAWVPVVQRMRPHHTWSEVVRALKTEGGDWSQHRLRRSVKKLIGAGVLDSGVLAKVKPVLSDARLARLVGGIRDAAPDKTLQQIAVHLEKMGERTARGWTRWHASTVKHFLKRWESGTICLDPRACVS